MIKVLYVPSLNIPICYWRIENYATEMVGMNKEVKVNVEYFKDIIPINSAWDALCVGYGETSVNIQKKIKNAFKFFDFIIFQRIQNKAGLALIDKMKQEFPNVKIIAELDDSIGDVSLSSPFKWTDQHRWSAEHIYRSDGVITSTQHLADSIKLISEDKPVHVAPNCTNYKMWKVEEIKKEDRKDIRFCYVGGGAHDEDLRILYKSILPILNGNEDVKLVIRYGGYRPKFLEEHKQIDFKAVAWCMDEYPQRLYDLDVDYGLAPLRDSEFNRCKSNVKWIEWSSLGKPLIASNVRPYRETKEKGALIELVEDNTYDSWRKTLNKCIEQKRKGKIIDSS